MSILEQRTSGDDARRRRRQIEERLAELGWRRRRPWLLGTSESEDTACPPRRLFEELGPVFAACGLQLAPRLDLLPEADCFELAVIADRGRPTPPEAVDEILRRELGHAPEATFAEFEPRPVRSGLLVQTHRARSLDGEELTVELVHAEVIGRLEGDLETLPLLAAPLAARALPAATDLVGATLAEARDAIRDATDFRLRDADSENFQDDAEPTSQRSRSRLATARLRIVAGPPTPTLAEVLESDDLATDGAGETLARHLWLRWLWQVLHAGRIPLDPRAQEILILEGRWPDFAAAGPRLPAADLDASNAYLSAMAADDPDAACDAVLRLTSPRPEADPARLRRRFRQLMPFRDSRQLAHGDTTAASLLLHQRLLGAHGFGPSPRLAELYRSLFWVRYAAQRLAPGRELLTEALEELRLVSGLGELRRQLDLAQLTAEAKKQASLWMELPQKLDAVLTRAARSAEDQARETGDSSGTDFPMVTAALLAAVVAVAVVGQRLAELETGAWADELGALLLLLLGAWFLGSMGRRRS